MYSESVLSHIERVYEKATSLKWLHNYSAGVCSFRQRVVQYPSRILAGLVGSGAAMDALANGANFDTSRWVISIATIISSILATVDSVGGWEARAVKHAQYRTRLQELTNRIEENVSLPDTKQCDSTTFVREVTLRLGHLMNGGAPDFVRGAEKRFSEVLERTGLPEYERPIGVRMLTPVHSPSGTPKIVPVDSEGVVSPQGINVRVDVGKNESQVKSV